MTYKLLQVVRNLNATQTGMENHPGQGYSLRYVIVSFLVRAMSCVIIPAPLSILDELFSPSWCIFDAHFSCQIEFSQSITQSISVEEPPRRQALHMNVKIRHQEFFQPLYTSKPADTLALPIVPSYVMPVWINKWAVKGSTARSDIVDQS